MINWILLQYIGAIIGNCLGIFFCVKVLRLRGEDASLIKHKWIYFAAISLFAFYAVFYLLKIVEPNQFIGRP